MKVKKGKKTSNIIAVILLIISLLMISSGFCYMFIDYNFHFNIIGDNPVEVGVNKKYLESGAIAMFFCKKIDNIKIKNNIDSTKIGNYQVYYTTSLFFITKKLIRKVIVKDLDKPTIKLLGEKTIYLNIGEDYIEPGYEASDDIDGDLTSKVVVENNLDNTKTGKYIVKYIVKDSSKNETIIEREVEVVDRQTILQSPLNSFNLDNILSDVILKYDPSKEYDFFNDTIFLGDSNVVFLYQRGNYISKEQAWGKLNLNIAQINSSTFTTFSNGDVSTLDNAVSTYKPKYLIASIGINTVLYMNRDDFIRETEDFISHMRQTYPNTQIIFTSVLPVYTGTLDASLQYSINRYNYYLLEICHKNKVNFINFSDRVKDSSGLANHDNFECASPEDCGFHLNANGRAYYIDYIKHLDLGRKLT